MPIASGRVRARIFGALGGKLLALESSAAAVGLATAQLSVGRGNSRLRSASQSSTPFCKRGVPRDGYVDLAMDVPQNRVVSVKWNTKKRWIPRHLSRETPRIPHPPCGQSSPRDDDATFARK